MTRILTSTYSFYDLKKDHICLFNKYGKGDIVMRHDEDGNLEKKFLPIKGGWHNLSSYQLKEDGIS